MNIRTCDRCGIECGIGDSFEGVGMYDFCAECYKLFEGVQCSFAKLTFLKLKGKWWDVPDIDWNSLQPRKKTD